jgi:hypothetical protein
VNLQEKRSVKRLWASKYVVAAAIFTLTVSAVQTSAQAGDGTITENFSMQFLSDTSFAPKISAPPQNDNYGAYLVMPPCIGAVKNDCIVSLEHTDAQGKWIKGKFKEYLPLKDLTWNDADFKKDYNSLEDTVFAKARPAQNFPAGGRTGIWQLSNAKHAGGSDYAVSIGFSGAASNVSNPRDAGSVIAWNASDGFNMKLFPISYDISVPRPTEKDKSGKGPGGWDSCAGIFGKASYYCVANKIHPFPPKTKFRISLNFKSTKSMISDVNWYFSRLFNAQVQESSNADNSISLAVEGSPTLGGSVYTEFPKNQINYNVLKKAYDAYWEANWGEKSNEFATYDSFFRAAGSGLKSSDPGTVSAWSILEDAFEFKYFYEEETWQFSTALISPADRDLTNRCSFGGLNPGVISTNAIAANPSPPKWNSETSELIYNIASPHLKKDGAVNSGVYELTIDKKLAECLWGLDPLNYRAAISVTAKDGTQKVSTTVFASSDKYLTFRAAGFSFSTSLIKVKLSNEKGSTAVKTALPDIFLETIAQPIKATPIKEATPKKTISITCVKGKLTKKVSGTSPKCPSGYKKK